MNTLSNMSALKHVSASTRRIRLVQSVGAFYHANPSSTATADDINVVEPNAGTGRWLKVVMRSQSQELVYVTVNGSQTVNAQPGCFYSILSANGTVTLNLPANPVAGQRVKMHHFSSELDNRTIINRNGRPIRGNSVSAGIELFEQYASVELVYRDNTVGWNWEGSFGVRQQTSVVTLTYVSDGDTNDLFHYLGRNENTVTWVNPASNNDGRPAKVMAVYQTTGGGASDNTALFDRTNSGFGASSAIYKMPGALVFVNVDNPLREFRLTRIGFRTDGSGNTAPQNYKIVGLPRNRFDGISPRDVGSTSTDVISRFLNMDGWETLLTATNDTTINQTANAWSSIIVNATKFYSAFNFYNIGRARNSTYHFNASELQFYGDLRQ